MNITNDVKGAAEKFRKFKWLGLAAVGLAGVSVTCWNSWSESRISEGADASVLTAQQVVDVKPHRCGHDHTAKARSIKEVGQVTISAAGSVLDAGLLDAEMGDVLELSFGDDLKISGEVNMNKEVVGGRKAIGMTLDEQGSYLYWLQDVQGGVIGNVVIKREEGNQVYKFTRQSGGWTLEEMDYQEYVCASDNKGENAGMPMSQEPFTPSPNGGVAVIPTLNSLAGATSVVYLDFDGEVVEGTRWNTYINQDIIDAQPSGHTEAEIRSIWEETSEDMRPFQLNVTTDRSVFDAAPVNRRMQVIITTTKDAMPSSGGVAWLDSFYDGSIDPCWAFNLSLSSCAMTCSHEVGHTLGLNHDGDPDGGAYHGGNGTWGPIMGAPFGHSVVSWSKGDYQGANNMEDDLSIIDERSASYREDDHGNSSAEATAISNADNGEAVVESGLIETTDDVDVFTFQTSGGLTALNISPVSSYPNMNIQVGLYGEFGNLIVLNDGSDYGASVSETLAAGVYYLHVQGVADGSPDDSGFTEYGSLGQFGITGNVAGLGSLIVDIVEPQPDEVSVLFGNGLVMSATTGGGHASSTWSQTSAPAGGVVTFAPDDTLATRAHFSKPGLYTVQFSAETEALVSSVRIQVSVEEVGDTQRFANRGPAITVTSPEEFYSREGTLNGQVLDDGVPVDLPPVFEWVVVSGNAEILNPSAPVPLIQFADSMPNVVSLESSDGEIKTFKEVTVTSMFEVKTLVEVGTPSRWFVPRSDALGMSWVAPQFDDSAWSAGQTGLGFNNNQDYATWIGAGGNLKSVMKNKSPSAFVRIPFTLPSPNNVQQLVLTMRYNDGFVAYLNGVEVVRRNAPAGPLVWSSVALTSRSLADVVVPDEIDLLSGLAAENLVEGENILAIHGLNGTKSGSQFLIDPKLEAGVISVPYLIDPSITEGDVASGGPTNAGGQTSSDEASVIIELEARDGDVEHPGDPSTSPVSNPLTVITSGTGKYSGFLTSTDGSEIWGYFKSINVSKAGTLSAKMFFDNVSYTLKGLFDESGQYSGVITPKKGSPATVNLQLVVTSGGGYKIEGTVVVENQTASVTAVKSGATTSQAGTYTVLVLGDEDEVSAVQGHGYAMMMVTSVGTAKMKGLLGDGTKWTAMCYITPDGEMPLYAALYRKAGSLGGLVRFRDVSGVSDCDGAVHWLKPGGTGIQPFPGGFNLQRKLIGSRYSNTGGRVISGIPNTVPNIEALVGEGSGDSSSSWDLEWTTANKIDYAGPEKVKVSVKTKTGQIKGYVSDDGTKLKVEGVVFQKQGMGVGLVSTQGQPSRSLVIVPKE